MLQRLLIIFISFTLLSACYDTGLESLSISSEYDVVYLDSLAERGSFTNDPYKVIAITPRGDRWDIIVEYPGGCGDHLFYLWWDGIVFYSLPPKLDLYLIHNGNEDLCKAIVRDTVSFSLDEALEGASFGEPAIVTLHNETDNQAIEVDPYIAELTTDNCDLRAQILNGNCNLGPLGSEWIYPIDDIENHEEVVLQPVRLTQDSTLLNIDSRQANVSVTVLFGFEYTTVSLSNEECSSWPEGTVVPVAVNCINPL